jgi:transposase
VSIGYKDRDWLYQKYVVEKLSTNSIAKLCNTSYTSVYYHLNKFNISRRSYSEASKIVNPKQAKICPVCGKTFYLRPSVAKNQIYCSQKCKKIGQIKRETRKCLVCGTKFECIPSKKKNYCSPECRIIATKRKRIKKKCIFCGRIFYVRKCEAKKRKYCSRQCSFKDKAKKVYLNLISIDRNWLYQKYIVEELSINKIAKILGVSSDTISRRLDEFGIKRRKGKYNTKSFIEMAKAKTDYSFCFGSEINLLRSLYYDLYQKQKKSATEIAKIVNTPVTTVERRLFKKMGLKRRGRVKKPSPLVKVYCQNCGKELWRYPSHIKKSKRQEFFCDNNCLGEWISNSGYRSGEKSYQWKGGISDSNKKIRRNPKYKQWRSEIYKRDHYTCQWCGKRCRSNDIVAHHIVEFSEIIDRFNIKSLKDALNCKMLWDIGNGVTLCRKCHHFIHHSKWGKEWAYYNLRSLTYKKTGLYRNEHIVMGNLTMGLWENDKGYEGAFPVKELTKEEKEKMLNKRYPMRNLRKELIK